MASKRNKNYIAERHFPVCTPATVCTPRESISFRTFTLRNFVIVSYTQLNSTLFSRPRKRGVLLTLPPLEQSKSPRGSSGWRLIVSLKRKTINNHSTVKQGHPAYSLYSVYRRNRDVGDAIPYNVYCQAGDICRRPMVAPTVGILYLCEAVTSKGFNKTKKPLRQPIGRHLSFQARLNWALLKRELSRSDWEVITSVPLRSNADWMF